MNKLTTYYQHFGLSGPPFHFTPSRRLYMSHTHREALAALEWGLLHEPSGFTLLTGETGAGKTTLVSSILMHQHEHVHVAYVSNPKSGFYDLLRAVMSQFGIEARPLRAEMTVAFGRYLAGLKREERVVIVVDEAQTATDETLEDIRLFSDCRESHDRQIHLLLIGQPELSRRLVEPRLKPLNDRIGARAMLEPLTREEALAYVDFQLREQGANARTIFKHRALEHIIEHSEGLPRRVSVLCHNAMLLAYAADRRKVTVSSARAAVDEYKNFFSGASLNRASNSASGAKRGRIYFARAVAAGTAIALLALGSGYLKEREAILGARAAREARAPRARQLPDPVASGAVSSVGPVPLPRPSMSLSTPYVEMNRAPATGGVVSTVEARAQGAAKPRPHWVVARRGDTLRSIALKYLGSEDTLDRLIAANPQLRRDGHIRRGEIVYLPNNNRPAAHRSNSG